MPTWQSLNGFQKSLRPCALKVAQALEGLMKFTKYIHIHKIVNYHMSFLAFLCFRDPYADSESDGEDDEDRGILKPMKIDIDLSVSAYANARR